MPRLPGPVDVIALLRTQTEALVALPSTVASLTSAVRGLADVVHSAREAAATVNRLAVRLDALVEDLEEPLRELAPGLRRLAVVLDDPVVDEVPDTLRKVRSEVLPVLRTLADTHERVALIAGSTERIMGFVDDTSRSLAHLPGAALLARRRVPARPVAEEPPAP